VNKSSGRLLVELRWSQRIHVSPSNEVHDLLEQTRAVARLTLLNYESANGQRRGNGRNYCKLAEMHRYGGFGKAAAYCVLRTNNAPQSYLR
jgi:hypothetical protein